MPKIRSSREDRLTDTLVLHRVARRHGVLRRVRLSAIVGFVALAALIVAGLGTGHAWPWVLLVCLGLLGAVLDMVDSFRWGPYEIAPFRPVLRTLVLVPEKIGFRELHRPRAVLVDGYVVDLGTKPFVTVIRSGLLDDVRYRVHIVLQRQIVGVDSFRDYESSIGLANKIADVLELAPTSKGELEHETEASHPRRAWIELGVVALLGCLAGVVWWSIEGGIVDIHGSSLATVAIIFGLVLVAGGRLRRRWVQADAVELARASAWLQ